MIVQIVKDTIMITAFVLTMMLIIEYINVQTKGKWIRPLAKKGWLQIIIAGVMGFIPGCLGTYTAVSLYSHRIISFAALVTVMIATSGDEAFIMLGIMPDKAFILFFIILGVALITGFILYAFMNNKTFMKTSDNHFKLHEEHIEYINSSPKNIVKQFKNISFYRALLIGSVLLFLFGLFSGELVHSHDFHQGQLDLTHENCTADHEGDLLLNDDTTDIHEHSHKQEYSLIQDHSGHNHGSNSWNWISTTFLIISLIALFIMSTVNDHFLEEHLWGHIIKKHFLKVFFWTFGALLLIYFISDYIDIKYWIEQNMITILVLAVLIGIIPQSGPHYIFVLLFAQGIVPFSILIANSIVQDGHGALPLIAESRKSFLWVKLINLIVGFIVGYMGLQFGF
jgi:uncharacterized protein YneF (UPF0154 family)